MKTNKAYIEQNYNPKVKHIDALGFLFFPWYWEPAVSVKQTDSTRIRRLPSLSQSSSRLGFRKRPVLLSLSFYLNSTENLWWDWKMVVTVWKLRNINELKSIHLHLVSLDSSEILPDFAVQAWITFAAGQRNQRLVFWAFNMLILMGLNNLRPVFKIDILSGIWRKHL